MLIYSSSPRPHDKYQSNVVKSILMWIPCKIILTRVALFIGTRRWKMGVMFQSILWIITVTDMSIFWIKAYGIKRAGFFFKWLKNCNSAMWLFNKGILILYKIQFCPLLTRNQLEEQRRLHGLSDTIEIKYLDKRVQREREILWIWELGF